MVGKVKIVLAVLLTAFLAMIMSQSAVASGEPIKIGVVTSRSGVFQEWGTEELRGLELGLEYATNGTNKVLGREIKLIVEDDTSKPDVGAQKAVKLLTEGKVDILTGAISSAVAMAIQAKVVEYKKPYIVSAASADQITGENFNRYTFRIGRSLRQGSLSGAKYIVDKMGKNIAILAADYAGGRSFVAAYKQDFIANGGKIVVELYAPLTTGDFTPYLQKIKASGANTLMVFVTGANFTTLLPKQIGEIGIYEKMKVATDFADITFFKSLGMAAVGMVGTCMYYYELFDNPLNKWLVEHHQKKFNAPPELWAGHSFATGIALIAAIKKAGSVETEALIKALEGLEFYGPKTTTEKIRIRPEDHQAMQGVPFVELVKVEGRDYPVPKLVFLPTAEQAMPPITVPKK
jgi:branched-chain amino acid transport system substrate-binding protein